MGRRPGLADSRTTKALIKKPNDRNAAPGGRDFGKSALERGALAFCRLAEINGLALSPASNKGLNANASI